MKPSFYRHWSGETGYTPRFIYFVIQSFQQNQRRFYFKTSYLKQPTVANIGSSWEWHFLQVYDQRSSIQLCLLVQAGGEEGSWSRQSNVDLLATLILFSKKKKKIVGTHLKSIKHNRSVSVCRMLIITNKPCMTAVVALLHRDWQKFDIN